MKKVVLVGFITFFSLLFTLLSYKAAYFIGERYFFDKLFYKKSIAHGYVSCLEDNCDWGRFGDRARDYISLLKMKHVDKTVARQVLGAQDESEFRVAVIGDSFVWGQGVRNEERMTQILDKKLNVITKTRVFSFAAPGDNILDNFAKLNVLKNSQFNSWIYVFVSNDILFEWYNRYDKGEGKKEIEEKCGDIFTMDGGSGKSSKAYQELTKKGWESEVNRCAMGVFIRALPKNTIVFFSNIYVENAYSRYFREIIGSSGRDDLVVVSPRESMKFSEYAKYWTDPIKYFQITKIEGHPSRVAQAMYADVLFKKITSSSLWGFNNK